MDVFFVVLARMKVLGLRLLMVGFFCCFQHCSCRDGRGKKVTGRDRGLNRGKWKEEVERKEHDTKSETEERRDEAFQGPIWSVGSSLLKK